jgi:hypothetical protein
MSETDRELLEMAAKAIGDGLLWWGEPLQQFMLRSEGNRRWNPLTDDGDALRLAVRLRMRLHVDDYGAAARITDRGEWSGCESARHGGIEAATRRAIVRAAANIGEQQNG